MPDIERIHILEKRMQEVAEELLELRAGTIEHGQQCDFDRRQLTIAVRKFESMIDGNDKLRPLAVRVDIVEEWIKEQKEQRTWLSHQIVGWWIVFGLTLALAVFAFLSKLGAVPGAKP